MRSGLVEAQGWKGREGSSAGEGTGPGLLASPYRTAGEEGGLRVGRGA